eukprot:scaffold23291_cov32-Prasinocladus_malaysianus.AAC.1
MPKQLAKVHTTIAGQFRVYMHGLFRVSVGRCVALDLIDVLDLDLIGRVQLLMFIKFVSCARVYLNQMHPPMAVTIDDLRT